MPVLAASYAPQEQQRCRRGGSYKLNASILYPAVKGLPDPPQPRIPRVRLPLVGVEVVLGVWIVLRCHRGPRNRTHRRLGPAPRLPPVPPRRPIARITAA